MPDKKLNRRSAVVLTGGALLATSQLPAAIGRKPDDSSAEKLYPFETLSGNPSTSTFAYWILVERKPLPPQAATPKALTRWMTFHYDVEEQAHAKRTLITNKELLPEYIQLIAPVTLAERWTPFSDAKTILGAPIRSERDTGGFSSALGVWAPKFLGACKLATDCPHTRHFVFLLGLACSVAMAENGRIIIAGCPGWSYSDWKDKQYMMNPDTAFTMHKFGYLYTDRIAQ